MVGIAVFRLEQARQAIALVKDSPDEADVWRGLDDFDRAEFYVLKLDHVYESCCELNKNWPRTFKKPVRNAANSFVQLWNGSTAQQRCEGCAKNDRPDGPTRQEQAACERCETAKQRCHSCNQQVCTAHARYRFGTDLRDAFAHYEGVLADPTHRLRGSPISHTTVRGAERPSWMKGHLRDPEKGPESFWLTGKDYRLSGVYEALVTLETELSGVLVNPETGQLREEA